MQCKATLTKEEDKHLPAFDYTKLTALNMCPRWGLVRYDKHKAMPGTNRRNMALELGHAAHEVFAAIRMFELLEYGKDVVWYGPSDLERIDAHGTKLFGEDRWNQLITYQVGKEDATRRARAIAFHIIASGDFYDDPFDKRRTVSNLEASCIAYIDRVELGQRIPIMLDNLVGVEVPFDLTLEFIEAHHDHMERTRLRYIGRMDGLVYTSGIKSIEVEENKTASRLDDSWMNSFLTSHQVTGYCVAASTLLQQPIRDAMIRGMMVPLPKQYDLGGIANIPVSRDEDRINEWYRWIYHTYTNQYLPYKDDPLSAPEYTHSCNRYFTSCSFIPLCAMASREERLETYNQMVTDEWSPLHD